MDAKIRGQDDEALRLLAQMYSRWQMRTNVGSVMDEVLFRIWDVLSHATSQQQAYEHLSQCAGAVSDHQSAAWKAYERALSWMERLIKTGGSAESIVVGQTDGYRHLCLQCSQDEHNFQRVRFFNVRERRPLLAPEVGDIPRSCYARCQLCRQPLFPQKCVLLTFGGTCRHGKLCNCGLCNRAGTAYLMNIYECEQSTLRVVFPFLYQVAAPGRQQSVARAMERCWEYGWYMFNKDAVLRLREAKKQEMP
jgi:hypothetical protein